MAMRAIVWAGLLACGLWAEDQAVKVEKPRRVRLGGITFGAGYTHFSGPFSYPWYPYYYRPYFAYSYWDPWFYHPYYGTGFRQQPGMGEIKLRTQANDAEVFLDGAYAGTAADLKSMWLEPGAYNLEVKLGDRAFSRRIYVLSGKTLRIEPKLEPQP